MSISFKLSILWLLVLLANPHRGAAPGESTVGREGKALWVEGSIRKGSEV